MNELFFGPPMEKLLKVVGEILVEVKEMRREYREAQAVYTEVCAQTTLSDIGSIEFNKSYEG